MEPERKIENLLRRFAKKRREQAGEPMDLHPANRRLLQAEVRRQFKRPTQDRSWLSLLIFRPAFMSLLGVLTVLALMTALLLLPTLSKTKSKSGSGTPALVQTEEREMTRAPLSMPARKLSPAAAPVMKEERNVPESRQDPAMETTVTLSGTEQPFLRRSFEGGTSGLAVDKMSALSDAMSEPAAGVLANDLIRVTVTNGLHPSPSQLEKQKLADSRQAEAAPSLSLLRVQNIDVSTTSTVAVRYASSDFKFLGDKASSNSSRFLAGAFSITNGPSSPLLWYPFMAIDPFGSEASGFYLIPFPEIQRVSEGLMETGTVLRIRMDSESKEPR